MKHHTPFWFNHHFLLWCKRSVCSAFPSSAGSSGLWCLWVWDTRQL